MQRFILPEFILMRQFTISFAPCSSCLLAGKPTVALPTMVAAYRWRGIAFYNFENLFDTIPNNPEGRDLEFTPQGPRQWDGRKYWERWATSHTPFRSSRLRPPLRPAIARRSRNREPLRDGRRGKPPRHPQMEPTNSAPRQPRRTRRRRGSPVQPRYFKLENVTNHRLTAVPFRTRDQMCVVGSLLGQRIAVIVNHWPSRIGGQQKSEPNRMAAAALSKSIADSLWNVDPEIGVIIMGDLNDDPMDKSCAEVLGARKSPKGVEAHGFFNPFWSKLDSGVGTLAYKSSWNLFDQIILSGNLVNTDSDNQWKFFEAKVLNFDFLKDTEGNRQGYPKRTYSQAGSYLGGYSDHFPTKPAYNANNKDLPQPIRRPA